MIFTTLLKTATNTLAVVLAGAQTASSTMAVSVWLNLHNRAQLDALAKELYDPAAPQYRQWLRGTEFAASYAPTAQEAAASK